MYLDFVTGILSGSTHALIIINASLPYTEPDWWDSIVRWCWNIYTLRHFILGTKFRHMAAYFLFFQIWYQNASITIENIYMPDIYLKLFTLSRRSWSTYKTICFT